MGSLPTGKCVLEGKTLRKQQAPRPPPLQTPPSGGIGLYIAGLGGWESFSLPLYSGIISWEITGEDVLEWRLCRVRWFLLLSGEPCSPGLLLHTCLCVGHVFSFPSHYVASVKMFCLG